MTADRRAVWGAAVVLVALVLGVWWIVRPAGAEWESVAPLRVPRDDFGLVAIDGRLWALGGMTGARGNVVPSVEVYDPGDDTWATTTEMPAPRSSGAAVALDGRIVFIGGFAPGGTVTDRVDSLDTRTGEWTSHAAMPTPRMQMAAAVDDDGTIWVIGGNDAGGTPMDVVEVYDPASDTWSTGPPLPTARYGLAVTVFEGRIMAIGGQDTWEPLETVESLDPASGTWRTEPSLPTGITRGGAAGIDRTLHVVYGDHHFAWEAGTREWESRSAPPTARKGLGVIAMDDRLITVGGCRIVDVADVAVTEVYGT